MIRPHLLPDQINQLLDDESAPSVAPLVAHLAECADCQKRVAEERRLDRLLGELPRHAPSHHFGDRVMSQLRVRAPWYVTAWQTVDRWAPRSPSARIGALTLAGSAASILTVGIVWVATRPDLVPFASDVMGSRARMAVVRGGSTLVNALLGDHAVTVVTRAGLTGLVTIGALMVAAVVGTLAALRAIASASSRRRA